MDKLAGIIRAMENANPHATMTSYNVIAAIKLANGQIFSGANFEFLRGNNSEAIHAEESAITSAANSIQGPVKIGRLYLAGKNFPTPCGPCRDLLLPLMDATAKISISETPTGLIDRAKVKIMTLGDLTPAEFEKIKKPELNPKINPQAILSRSQAFFSNAKRAAIAVTNSNKVLIGTSRETATLKPATAIASLISNIYLKVNFKQNEKIETVYYFGNDLAAPCYSERQDLFELRQLQEKEFDVIMMSLGREDAMQATTEEMLPHAFSINTFGENDKLLAWTDQIQETSRHWRIPDYTY